MRFLRRRSNHTIVALLAVAMQAALALSYGHIHAHGHLPGGTQAWAKSVAAMACRAMVRPAGCPKPIPHDEAECAACWSMASAGVGLLPVIALPAVANPELEARPPLRTGNALSGGGSASFQARAPPRA
jgi:hypothetical protein